MLALPAAGPSYRLIGRRGRKVAIVIDRRRRRGLAGWLIRNDCREEATDMSRNVCADLLIEGACRPLGGELALEQICRFAFAWGTDSLGLVCVRG